MEKGFTIKVLDKGFVRYIDHLGSDLRIVEAARISYKSPSKGDESDKKLLKYLWKNKHTSPFEQCVLTLNIKMPIFVMRQFVRHRTQSLNEVSARYTELPEEFYIPETFRIQSKKNKQGSEEGHLTKEQTLLKADLLEGYKNSYKIYSSLLKEGVAKEMARFILPVGIYTEIYTTMNLRNLLHFFMLRDDPHAQWEHQQYGKAIKEICKELFPWTIEAYEEFK